MHGISGAVPYHPPPTGAVTPTKAAPPMPRQETAVGVIAAGVLVIAIATATVRGGDPEPGIDDPIGAPTSTASETPTGGLPATEPAPTEPTEPTATETTEPAASASDRDPTSASEPSSETASPTASPSPTSTVSPTETTAPTDDPSDDDDDLDDMPDTGGGTLALLGGVVAGVGLMAVRRRR